MRVCIGIVCIGQSYLAEFERLFKPSISAYCAKNGYDLKIFTEFLDSRQSHTDTISFQKCLVPSALQEYDVVVVLDADIYIENGAPPIHTLSLNGKLGIVNEVAQSTEAGYREMVDVGFADYGNTYYSKAGFELNTSQILNTGVIICRPHLHRTYLQAIYEKYVDTSIGHPRGFHYEQASIGFELHRDSSYQLISNDWNFIYVHTQLTRDPIQCYFLHFAGLRGPQREAALTRHTLKSRFRWGVQK